MTPPPSPVEISHKKDGRQRWPYRFHVSWPPPPTRPLDSMLANNRNELERDDAVHDIARAAETSVTNDF